MKEIIIGIVIILVVGFILSFSVGSFPVSAEQPPQFEYQFKTDVDICVFVTLGNEGFEVIRTGTSISGFESGKNHFCEVAAVRKLDWVLFGKQI